ncbi:MAG: hypothetical protein HPY90_12990 [Syntrophothermus sp.]|uniref:hypothetical protein n=1 Tax=Syntrophothermus sp. TaxID=2736299 RepID=UPI00257AD3E8|nr:hypothetical protein [Syntrophothermus sp.]NSW84164.1 hypothetical protein [Syntrophothermus sp.]
MEARELIQKMRVLLDKGVNVALATGSFIVRFPDGKMQVLDLEDFIKTADKANACELPLFFGGSDQ